jgi:hypothetical protein
MYIDTRKITRWTGPDPEPTAPWKLLNPRDRSYGHAEFHLKADAIVGSYYGRPYGLNTKYIVEMEDDDVVGCHVSLANGSKVWVDETVAGLTVQSNRR